jgi:hypothetical protein
MKTFKIKQKDYYSTDAIEIEMTKVVAPAVEEVTKTETLTVGQIKEKIEKVREEKRIVVERYDAEIDELKDMLDTLKVDKVKILKQPQPAFSKELAEKLGGENPLQ